MNLDADPMTLTDAECDWLNDVLARAPGTRSLEWVDGYFCALIAGPELVSLAEAAQELLGDDTVLESQDEARTLLSLLARHWNVIAAQLEASLDGRSVYLPLLYEDEAGVTRGNDWAKGFLHGAQARPGSWDALFEDENEAGAVLPMMILAHEHDAAPELRPPPLTTEKREDVLMHMAAGLARAYRYFEPARRQPLRAAGPVQRSAPKVGRNEPCPCGSGRKFKHCCAAAPH